MANQQNFVTDVLSNSNLYKKFTVSRIVDNPASSLIRAELPTTLPPRFVVETNLYSLFDNRLIYTSTIDSEENVLGQLTFQYLADGTIRRFLTFDFSKTDIVNIDGRYQIVLNFFVPIIGHPDTASLRITRISPSRTELELQLLPAFKTNVSASQLKNFSLPQINSTWAIDALKYICNQTQSLNPNIPTDKTVLTPDIVKEYLPISQSNKLNNPDVVGEYTQSVKDRTQVLLNSVYTFATKSINELPPGTRLTNERFTQIMSSSIVSAMQVYSQTSTFTFV